MIIAGAEKLREVCSLRIGKRDADAHSPDSAGRGCGQYAVIDVETGEYEIDSDELAASDRFWRDSRMQQVWLRQSVPVMPVVLGSV